MTQRTRGFGVTPQFLLAGQGGPHECQKTQIPRVPSRAARTTVGGCCCLVLGHFFFRGNDLFCGKTSRQTTLGWPTTAVGWLRKATNCRDHCVLSLCLNMGLTIQDRLPCCGRVPCWVLICGCGRGLEGTVVLSGWEGVGGVVIVLGCLIILCTPFRGGGYNGGRLVQGGM